MSIRIYAGGLLRKCANALLGSHYVHVYSHKAVVWFDPMKPAPVITYVNRGDGRFIEAKNNEHYAELMVNFALKSRQDTGQ